MLINFSSAENCSVGHMKGLVSGILLPWIHILRIFLFFSWQKVEWKEKSARFLACKSQLKIRTASVSQVCLLRTEHIPGVKVTCIHSSWSSRQCCTVAVPSLFYLWEKWRPQGCWVARAEPGVDPAQTDPKALAFTLSQPSVRRAFTVLVELSSSICQIFQIWKSTCSAAVAATHKSQGFIFQEWGQQGTAACTVVLRILDGALWTFKVLQWLSLPTTGDLITDCDHTDPLLPLTASPFPSNTPFYTCMSFHWTNQNS